MQFWDRLHGARSCKPPIREKIRHFRRPNGSVPHAVRTWDLQGSPSPGRAGVLKKDGAVTPDDPRNIQRPITSASLMCLYYSSQAITYSLDVANKKLFQKARRDLQAQSKPRHNNPQTRRGRQVCHRLTSRTPSHPNPMRELTTTLPFYYCKNDPTLMTNSK